MTARVRNGLVELKAGVFCGWRVPKSGHSRIFLPRVKGTSAGSHEVPSPDVFNKYDMDVYMATLSGHEAWDWGRRKAFLASFFFFFGIK